MILMPTKALISSGVVGNHLLSGLCTCSVLHTDLFHQPMSERMVAPKTNRKSPVEWHPVTTGELGRLTSERGESGGLCVPFPNSPFQSGQQYLQNCVIPYHTILRDCITVNVPTMGDLVGGELLSPVSCNYYVSTKIDIFPCLCIHSPGLLLELPVTGELGGDVTAVFISSVEKSGFYM